MLYGKIGIRICLQGSFTKRLELEWQSACRQDQDLLKSTYCGKLLLTFATLYKLRRFVRLLVRSRNLYFALFLLC